ncbi:hypothetical protein HER10_EVM0011269 [Colletotrichum scovillei]|uniref:uncharacterized protein n=1 Tax=Colletotrichum scovillei TaxID=1209932 RepID=UPI0015C2D692|nr:uncharacterized protein HER10_EVM0011269 [Colletotrichum scovillei]KAF4785901.1 hypothetical protein HER10_EVM0011269 [Colletotrichum scovillei]
MSTTSSPSPLQGPTGRVDEKSLPQGQCRYILLVPGIKGQRCACVHFSLNRSTPGASCDCGHMACYHVKTPEPSSTREEVELLKQRLQALEEQLDQQRQGGLGTVVARVSELEDLVDKSREEIGQEIKGSYRNINRVWQSVEQLERQTSHLRETLRSQSEHMERVNGELKSVSNRQLELFDADESIEERLDQLESDHDSLASRGGQIPNMTEEAILSRPDAVTASNLQQSLGATLYSQPEAEVIPGETIRTSPALSAADSNTSSSNCGAWTVHISLLPTASQPFPFERDTNAYKRCLSRGLHRTVVVGGPDSDSFVEAVTKSFGSLLRGRSWMPLQAKLCDAEKLQGLPMLRPLDSRLVDSDYDLNFLKRFCGVCEANGKIDSLYIAMRQDKFSWHFLRNSPIFIEGLENCWIYDHFLDPNDPVEDDHMEEHDRPSAGDIVPSLPNLKRAASEMSRTAGLTAATTGSDSDGSRTKTPRTSCLPSLVESRRRLETV